MKKVLIFALLGLLSCNEGTPVEPEHLTACGVTNPAENLPWLKALIQKGEEDRLTGAHKGNYRGQIYLKSWQGEAVFWTSFKMGSGGSCSMPFLVMVRDYH